MPEIPIREIIFDPTGGVRVAPALKEKGCYDQVYRAAMSVRWDHESQQFHMAPRGDRQRTPVEAFQTIVTVVASEIGDQLVITDATVWRGISSADQEAMLASQRSAE